MSIYIDPKGNKIRVRHFLADGREVEDIEGHFVPYNEQNAGIYHVLRGIARRIMSEAEEGGGT